MANAPGSTAFAPGQRDERALFCSNYKRGTSEHSRTDAIRHSPLVSLAVKDAVNNNKKPASQPSVNPVVNPQTHTLFGSTGFAGAQVGRPLFAGSPSQKPQHTTNPLPSFAFGSSNSQSTTLPSQKPQITTNQPPSGTSNSLFASNSNVKTTAIWGLKEGAAVSQTFGCTHAAGTSSPIHGTIPHLVYAHDIVLALHAIHTCTVCTPA